MVNEAKTQAQDKIEKSFPCSPPEGVINIDQSAFVVYPTLLNTVPRRHLWVVALFQKYPASFAASP
jgi:hypothetical protein